MVRFACPSCSKTLDVNDALGGRKGKCPGCGNMCVVPAVPAPVPPPLTAPRAFEIAPQMMEANPAEATAVNEDAVIYAARETKELVIKAAKQSGSLIASAAGLAARGASIAVESIRTQAAKLPEPAAPPVMPTATPQPAIPVVTSPGTTQQPQITIVMPAVQQSVNMVHGGAPARLGNGPAGLACLAALCALMSAWLGLGLTVTLGTAFIAVVLSLVGFLVSALRYGFGVILPALALVLVGVAVVVMAFSEARNNFEDRGPPRRYPSRAPAVKAEEPLAF